jgi:class 3 adenylate cyclase
MFARLRRRQRRGLPTFVFVDLVGFTAATERLGDEAAADLAREFRRSMCALSCRLNTRLIKSMGDGVMIWARSAHAATSFPYVSVSTPAPLCAAAGIGMAAPSTSPHAWPRRPSRARR